MFAVGLFQLVMVLFFLAYIAFAVAAAVSIVRSYSLTGAGKALWLFLIFTFPLFGSLIWFIWGQSAQLDASQAQEVPNLHS